MMRLERLCFDHNQVIPVPHRGFHRLDRILNQIDENLSELVLHPFNDYRLVDPQVNLGRRFADLFSQHTNRHMNR